MLGIFWLAFLGLIIYLVAHRKGPKPYIESAEARLAQRNIEWSRFIEGYRKVVTSKAEKALIDRMLTDIRTQGLVGTTWEMPESDTEHEELNLLNAERLQPSVTQAAADLEFEPTPLAPPSAPKVDLDNISLLLYFGAFLFVASVGLFIGFGGANGVVRTVAVLIVTGVLYSLGIWLFHNRPKLEQAGIAFSGIGMTVAPLSGVAAYNYIFAQSNGSAVWFLTSLLCLGMYVHALWTFRRPLVSYILIFTFVSLFEAGVSILAAPIYYFGWAMALVGIILAVVSRIKGFWPEVQESSRASSQLILPLAVLMSAVMVPAHGAGQLGVSLLFAAAYYGLEALNTKDLQQQNNANAAHIAALLSIGSLSYAFGGHSWKVVAASMLVVNVVQLMCILLIRQRGALWRNFASVVLGTAIAGVVLSGTSPGLMLVSTTAVVVIGLVIWQRQQRVEAYVMSVVAWMALPLVFGQNYLSVKLDARSQVALMFSALLVQLGVYIWRSFIWKDTVWQSIAQQLYVVSSVSVLVASLFASAWVCFLIVSGIVASMILLAEEEKDSDWSVLAGIMAVVPIIRTVGTPGALVASTMAALLLNIILALRYRKESNRWLSTGLWLVLPLSLGAGLFGHWTATAYAWGYLLVVLALVLSRIIARGDLLVSAKVPLASYAKNASLSYEAGYWLAAAVAVGISLASNNSQLHTSLILLVLTPVVYCLGRYVERRPDIFLLLPLLAQAILWSVLRPITGTSTMTWYLLATTGLAVASYFAWSSNHANIVKIREGSLASLFIAPATILIVSDLLWPMPLGLLIAGIVVYYHIRNTSQQNREVAGGLILAALLWFLWYAGVREIQAYSHMIVALLVLYAYWRHVRGETTESDQYIMMTLGTATVPLVLQAVGGQAGGLYGWWLLLEQVAFMLIGMAIKKRVVILWGLYVAVGAVLYQLRGLGWAALTVLAVFLIGIAVYKLQKPANKN